MTDTPQRLQTIHVELWQMAPMYDGDPYGKKWRADINEGVGHHGYGDTPTAAVEGAMKARGRALKEQSDAQT